MFFLKLREDVNDENNDYDQDEEISVDNDSMSATPSMATRSSQRIKNNEKARARLFNLMICKNDNIDYEPTQAMADDVLIDFNSKDFSGSTISVIADFNANFSKRSYKQINVSTLFCSSLYYFNVVFILFACV